MGHVFGLNGLLLFLLLFQLDFLILDLLNHFLKHIYLFL